MYPPQAAGPGPMQSAQQPQQPPMAPQPGQPQMGNPSAQPGQAPGPQDQAQVQQLAQQMAMQQMQQAKQMFMQTAQMVVSLGDQFPDQKEKLTQVAAAVMQIASDAIATLQAQPVSPSM